MANEEMKTIKTAELTGAALDWAVAKCEGRALREPRRGTNEEAESLRMPFKMFEVVALHKPDNTIEHRIETIKVTRYGISDGCSAPSIDFTDSEGRKACGSVDLFFFDRAEAELELQEYTHGPVDGFTPSRSWMFGGPIIDREHITLLSPTNNGSWNWIADKGRVRCFSGGADRSPLTAAMRCHVTSKLGDEVEVPEELL